MTKLKVVSETDSFRDTLLPGSLCALISQLLLWWQCLLTIYKPRPSDEMFYSCKVKPLKGLVQYLEF